MHHRIVLPRPFNSLSHETGRYVPIFPANLSDSRSIHGTDPPETIFMHIFILPIQRSA